eukprot:16629-Rhodomonas_salina.1
MAAPASRARAPSRPPRSSRAPPPPPAPPSSSPRSPPPPPLAAAPAPSPPELRVEGSGFRVEGRKRLMFRVWCLAFGVFGLWGLRGLGFRVQGLERRLHVQGLGSRV